MLYHNKKKKQQHLLALRKQVNQPYIGVIETTIMYHSTEMPKEHLISVFTLFVEEPSRHLILIRFYEDFVEFDKRIKTYCKKFRFSLPRLQKQHSKDVIPNSTTASTNDTPHSFRKILHSFSNKSAHKKNNADNIERYLRHCVNDLNIQKCSLFEEFLQPQREEDNVIPKEVIRSYVQQESNIIIHDQNPNRTRAAISPSITTNRAVLRIATPTHTPPPDNQSVTTYDDDNSAQSSFMSYTSFPSLSINPGLQPPPRSELIYNNNNDTEMTTTSISSSTASSTRPATIQDFQLIKVIGRGCMGKVLLVRHRATSRLLALKAISKKAVIEQSQIVHIKAEQQILSDIASIHHPFLIKLHYSFQDMNQLFLVLDYHVGGDLATQLRINHILPPERCRFYTAEIILGIQELHRLGILYRDLKPENVLLTADGHLVLTDFGLSKQFYDGLSLEEQRTDTFCGTAEYLAPEILNGQPYSYEVDYWSMGTILFEMLIGITPFWAENREDMYQRIRTDPLQFPEYIDIETADFIARLLKRDPKRRLGSGSDGAIRVRSDPYFDSIDWNLIYTKRIRPPYIPALFSETDFSHFDSEFLRLTPRLSPVGSDVVLSQSLDCAFEGYSYTNREEVMLDSPPSELYSLNEPPSPITLMDTNGDQYRARPDSGSGIMAERGTRYYVYNDSDDVVPYDDYVDDSNDEIRSSDLIPSTDYQRQFSAYEVEDEDDFDYYRQLPPRPTTRPFLSPSFNQDDDNYAFSVNNHEGNDTPSAPNLFVHPASSVTNSNESSIIC